MTPSLALSWWVWAAAAIVMAAAEVLLPGYIMLGFAIGAGAVALLLALGDPQHLWAIDGLHELLLAFAVVSLLAWVGLRRWAGVRRGQTRIIRHDINEE